MKKKYKPLSIEKSVFNFNKEIIIGECGAAIFAPIVSFIFSYFTTNSKYIAISAVVGSMLGAAIFFLTTRIIDKNMSGNYSISRLADDLKYFTPAAFLLTLLVYYPTLYLVSNHFIDQSGRIVLSVVPSQIIAFLSFLISINLYRIILYKAIGKVL